MNTCTSQLQRVRVTLDFEVYEDFNTRQIDYEALFDSNGADSFSVCIEELSETYDAMYQQLEDNSL